MKGQVVVNQYGNVRINEGAAAFVRALVGRNELRPHHEIPADQALAAVFQR
jgi:hypothetical protein